MARHPPLVMQLVLFIILALVTAAIVAAIATWVAHRRALARLSVQSDWELLYADEGGKRVPLLSMKTGDAHLVGRPDRVYRIPHTGEAVIVEDKSRPKPPILYDSHRMQLGAYVLLVEEQFGLRVSHALVRYSDGAIDVPVDDVLRTQVHAVLAEMAHVDPRHLFRNHEQPGRCRNCQYRPLCPQAMENGNAGAGSAR